MLARIPDVPLTSRVVSASVSTRFSADARGAATRSARAPRTATGVRTGGGGGGGEGGEVGIGAGSGVGGGGENGGLAVTIARDVNTLEVQRTQWVEVDRDRGGEGGEGRGGGGGEDDDGNGDSEGGRVQGPEELMVVGREAYDSARASNKAGGNARRSGGPEATRPSTAVLLKPRAKLAWEDVAVGPSTAALKMVRGRCLPFQGGGGNMFEFHEQNSIFVSGNMLETD